MPNACFMKKEHPTEADLLRQKAEALLKKKPVKSTLQLSETETLKLIHELEVQRIELEIQNEEIMLAKELADAAARKYAEFFDFAPTGYFILSKEGKIKDLNLRGSQLLGKERLHLLNSTFGFFVSDDTKPVFNLFLGNLYKSRARETCEVTLNMKVNPPVYVHLTGIASQNGEQCFLTVVDITERKRSEETLKDSEKQTRAIIDALPDMMFMLNSHGVYLAYKADKEDLYYQPESIIGKKNRDITPPEFADLIDEKVHLTLQTGQLQVFDYQLPVPSRGIGVFEARMVPIDSDKVIAVVRDITERKKTEEEMILKNIQLQEVNAEKDKFFSIIAHDLRSPFTSFLGFTKILAEEMHTLSLGQIQKIAVSMKKSASNLYNLLTNLLEWSRLQRGVTGFQPEPFFLMPGIPECLESVVETAGKKGIGITFEIPPDLQIMADQHMLQTIIRNLASNAVKYTTKGGRIEISAKTPHEKNIEFSVKDNGIGIPQHLICRLFRFDQQPNRPGTENEPSTGLGLIICKEFVEKHGGNIWVESEEGKGSAFHFTLPEVDKK